MNWLRRMFTGARPDPWERANDLDAVSDERERTERTMAIAVVFGMQAQDAMLGVSEHSARVSLLADWIARRASIHEADRHILQLAARLHEIGMFAVPAALLDRPAPLSSVELATIRAQARVSAEVARLAHPPRVAQLIEHQYEDHGALARSGRISERELLLAGILRVADVCAAVTWPRPYQDPMPVEIRNELLEHGAGTRFHPVAVVSALTLGPRI